MRPCSSSRFPALSSATLHDPLNVYIPYFNAVLLPPALASVGDCVQGIPGRRRQLPARRLDSPAYSGEIELPHPRCSLRISSRAKRGLARSGRSTERTGRQGIKQSPRRAV